MALSPTTNNLTASLKVPLTPVDDDKPYVSPTSTASSSLSQENKERVEKHGRLTYDRSPITEDIAYTFTSSSPIPRPSLPMRCIQQMVKPLALFTNRESNIGKGVRISATLLAFLMLVSIHFISGPLATALLLAAIGLSTINISRSMMELTLENKELTVRGMEPVSWYKTKMTIYSLLLLAPCVTPLLMFSMAPKSFQFAKALLEMEKTFNKGVVVTAPLIITTMGQAGLWLKELRFKGGSPYD